MRRKKMYVYIILLFIVGLSLFFIPWTILVIRLRPLPATIQEEIEQATSTYGFDGMMVYVNDSNGTSIYKAGYNNRDEKQPIEDDVLFKIASISKLYMAVAATKLIDTGTLNLDDTLAHLLPQYKDDIEYSGDITLRLLIQHRSGIPDYIDSPSFPWTNLPTNTDDVMQLILGQEALFKPDAKYDYCNTNYLLLAKIMDDALGYPHDQYIEEEILVPLDLHHTYYYYKDTNSDDVMSGYTVGYPFDLKPNDHITPGGTMVASISDLGRFIRALNEGTLFTPSENELYSSLYPFDHTGLLPGYQSIARYDKEHDRVIIMFTNTSGKDSWYKFELIFNRILRIITD